MKHRRFFQNDLPSLAKTGLTEINLLMVLNRVGCGCSQQPWFMGDALYFCDLAFAIKPAAFKEERLQFVMHIFVKII
jgi:hypothetical protein